MQDCGQFHFCCPRLQTAVRLCAKITFQAAGCGRRVRVGAAKSSKSTDRTYPAWPLCFRPLLPGIGLPRACSEVPAALCLKTI